MAKQKNNRKKKEEKREDISTSQMSFKSSIVLILCVIVVFLGFYLFTLYMTRKEKTDLSTTESEEVSFSYDTILLGRSLSMTDNDYYVMFFDFSDTDHANTYQSLFNSYLAKEEHLPIYKVDMGSGFNKKYVAEVSNKNPSSIEEFAINGITLIEVVDQSIVKYIEGEEEVTNTLS